QQSGGQGTSDRFLDFFRRTELSGFVDGYYGYNFNTPVTRKAGPERTFDVNHNSFSLNLAELSLEKKPTSDSRGGFRLDLDFGPTQEIVNATDKPISKFTATETYIGGPHIPNTTDWRHVSDTVATYSLTPKLSLAGNYDYGRDKERGARVRWQGVAGYGKFQANDWFALVPRWEYYDDEHGF